MKKSKKMIAILATVTMATAIMPAVPQAAAKPKLSSKYVSIAIGKKATIKVKNGKIKTVKSSKAKVAKVKKKGIKKFVITGKKAGKATIKVKLKNGKTLKCKVKVQKNLPATTPTTPGTTPTPITNPGAGTTQVTNSTQTSGQSTSTESTSSPVSQPDSIAWNGVKTTMAEGDIVKTSYEITPSGAFKPSFSSSNTDIITVDNDGTIHALKRGYATVYMKVGERLTYYDITVNPGKADSIEWNNVPETLRVTQTRTTSFDIQPYGYFTPSFTSSDQKVVTIDSKGTIKAVGEGSATVTMTAGGLSKSYTITVERKVTGVSITEEDEYYGFPSMLVGDTIQIHFTTAPEGVEYNSVTYDSDKPSVASIDENGLVTAESSGKAYISVTVDGIKEEIFVPVYDKKGICGGGVTYTLDDNGKLTISGSGSIDEDSFWLCRQINSVVINKGITEISNDAFDGCFNMSSVVIPNTVKKIGILAFTNCEKLTSVTLPNSLEKIDTEVFACCDNLETITIPNSVTEIGSCAFYFCPKLTDVTIPDSVTEINSDAFKESPNVVIHASSNSYAHTFATKYNIPFVATD